MSAMMNFMLGTIAGGLVIGIATISAVRQPAVQARLGLYPVSTAMMMPAAKAPEVRPVEAVSQGGSHAESPCRPMAGVGQPDMLFSKRRFWSVAP